MCGIAGAIGLRGQTIDSEVIIKMSNSIRHRGPDDEGYVFIQQRTGDYKEFSSRDSVLEVRDRLADISHAKGNIANNIGFAHRRFSIIDLTSGGHQPFFDRDRVCCVVFNGEIYNYIEVRKKLENVGHIFVSNSDTEVIVEAYKEWGIECFSRFNGMWGLALFDFRSKTLVFSRDRLGKEPLYWTKRDDIVYFASEIKSLLQVVAVSRTLSVDEAAIKLYLDYGLRDLDNKTFFQGIHSLPAASWSLVDDTFPNNIHYYWRISSNRLKEREISVTEACRSIKEILSDAVRIRMRADVPWAIQLSGGMDSSTLVAIAAQFSEKPLTTYTVKFSDAEWNEEPYARSVANYYNTDYRVIVPPLNTFWNEITPFTYLEEEPYHSPNLHTEQIMRRIMRTQGFKVLLQGAGGDELFAGYNTYFLPFQVENLLKGRVRGYLNNWRNWSEGQATIWNLRRPIRYLLMRSIKRIATSLGTKAKKKNDSSNESLPKQYDFLTLNERLYNDIRDTLIPYWLRSADKTHMGVPIETRMPFLDYRLVEFATLLPVTYLIRNGWHKWILRKAVENILPKNVVWRKLKMGFPFPYKSFFTESQPMLRAILAQRRNPYVEPVLRDITERPLRAWRLVSFLLWYEFFFNKNYDLFDSITRLSGSQGDGSVFTPWFLRNFEHPV